MNLFDVYPLFDIAITKGKGAYVFDASGQPYLDFYGGHAVISVGHSHPHYIKRLYEQLQQIGFYSNSILNHLQQDYAQQLGQLSDCSDYQFFFINSGAEAIENALKVASFHNQKSKVITFEKGFHGRTAGAVSITDNSKIQTPFNEVLQKVILPKNDLEGVRQHLQTGTITAIVLEGIQGIGGIHVPDQHFLIELAQLCKRYDALLILDEIQSGFGRSGKFFAFQYADIQPDIITVAKGMGNGFPMGGVLIHPDIKPWYGMLGSTFGGNHLACAAGMAVLEIIAQEDLMENAKRLGEQLKEQLRPIAGVREVRGLGLMIGLELAFPVKALRKQLLFEQKVFTGSSSDPNVLRLLPPLNITTKEVQLFVEKFEHAMQLNEVGV
ncbi:MAG: aminotransferase class III-fold pyridoxal phosphate-dependent enzyme [Bacteroidota bacterium]